LTQSNKIIRIETAKVKHSLEIFGLRFCRRCFLQSQSRPNQLQRLLKSPERTLLLLLPPPRPQKSSRLDRESSRVKRSQTPNQQQQPSQNQNQNPNSSRQQKISQSKVFIASSGFIASTGFIASHNQTRPLLPLWAHFLSLSPYMHRGTIK
jgi:hypothetical protein